MEFAALAVYSVHVHNLTTQIKSRLFTDVSLEHMFVCRQCSTCYAYEGTSEEWSHSTLNLETVYMIIIILMSTCKLRLVYIRERGAIFIIILVGHESYGYV